MTKILNAVRTIFPLCFNGLFESIFYVVYAEKHPLINETMTFLMLRGGEKKVAYFE